MTTYTWKSGISGGWTLAADWTPTGGPPNGATSDAVLGASGNYTVTIASGTSEVVDSLLFNPAAGTLAVAGTLALGGAVAAMTLASGVVNLTGTISGGVVSVSGGVLKETGTTGLITSAVVATDGSIVVASGDTLTIAGPLMLNQQNASSLDGPGTLVTRGTTTVQSTFIDGSLTWDNTGTVLAGAAIYTEYSSGGGKATIANLAGGVFALGNGGSAFYQYNSAPLVFSNAGLLTTSGGGTEVFDNFLTNTGTVSGGAATLDLANGGALGGTIVESGTGAVVLSGGVFALTGTVLNNGTLAIANGAALTIGTSQTIAGPVALGGTISISGGASLTLTGPLTLNQQNVSSLDGPGTLVTRGTTTVQSTYIDGSLTWNNAGTVLDGAQIYTEYSSGGGRATIANLAGGVFDFTFDGAAFYNYNNTQVVLSNAGILAKTGGTGTTAINVVVLNTGTIAASSGTLALEVGGTLSGSIGATGTGVVDLDGGLFTIGGSVQAISGSLALSGGTISIGSGKTLTLSGPVAWSNTDIAGPGTLTTTGSTTITNYAYLDGGLTWVNSGSVAVNGYYIYDDEYQTSSTAAFTISNLAGGVFNLTGNGYSVFYNGWSSAGATFTNAGLLEQTAGSSTTYVYAALNNTGTVAVTSGWLALAAGGVLGGTINVGGKGLDLYQGNFTLTGAVTSTGTLQVDSNANVSLGTSLQSAGGSFVLNGGSVTLSAAETIAATTTLGGGTISVGSGKTLTLSGPVAWSNTDIAGPGTLTTTGSTTITNHAYLDGGLTWVNSGSVAVNGYYIYDDEYQTSSTAAFTISNLAGGVFNLTGNGYSVFYNGWSSAGATFTNAGLLEQTAGSSTTYVYAVLNNTGTVTATHGTFEFEAGGTLNGSVGGAGAGVVQLNAGIWVTTGTATVLDAGTASDLRFINAASWTDTGTILDAGRLWLGNNNGTTTLSISAGANFDFTTNDGYIVNGGGAVLTNAGTIAKIGGTGTSTVGIGFANTGLVDAAVGTLKLAAGLTGTGQLRIESGATLELASAAVVGSNTIDLNGFGATLRIDNNGTVSKPIIGLGLGSRIDLAAAPTATAMVSGNTLIVTAGTSTLNYVSTSSLVGLKPVITNDGGSGSVITLYSLAAAAQHTPEPVSFGAVHQGPSITQTVTLTNTAPGSAYTEKLDAVLSTTATGFTASGSITGLAGGASDASALSITLNAASPGLITGAGTIALRSDGTGIDNQGTTALPSQTVNVSGTVFAYAAPLLNTGTINLGATRSGGPALTGSVTLNNGTTATPYQESLVYQFSTLVPGGLILSSGSGTLAAGGSVVVGVTLGTSGSGTFSAVNADDPAAGAAFTSSGVGTSGLASTALTAPALVVNGQVFAAAIASPSATTINFGVVHTGQTVAPLSLGITNTATGALTDVLTFGSVVEAGNYTGTVTSGLGTGLVSGAAGSLSFALQTGTAGVQSGTVTLDFLSHDTALADLNLAVIPITVTGTIDNYATAGITVLSGGTVTNGPITAQVVNLGTIQQNAASRTVTLDVVNSATGQADMLSGTFALPNAAGFTNQGFAGFSGLGSGQVSNIDTVVLATGTVGVFTETITLIATGSDPSYTGTLAAETLTITGTIVNTATMGPTYTLTPAPITIVATASNDTFIATNGALNSRDTIVAGTGTNTLVLSGGGIFDLNAPRTLSNIQVLDATEGGPAYINNGSIVAAGAQTVFLRDGLNMTVNVTSAATSYPGGLPATGITIYGGNDASTLNLGGGTDLVVLGSKSEVVNAGGGTDLVQAPAAFASAKVVGSTTGQTTLEITSAGTVTLNAATNHATIQIDQASSVTLDAMKFITAVAGGAGTSITGGVSGQTLIGSAAYGDTFLGTTAVLNQDTIGLFGGSDTIDVTNLAASTAGFSWTQGNGQGTLALTAGGKAALSIVLIGTYTTGAFSLGTDGHSGTAVTFV